MKKRAEWGKTIIGRSLSVPGGQDYNKLHTGIYYILYSLPPPPPGAGTTGTVRVPGLGESGLPLVLLLGAGRLCRSGEFLLTRGIMMNSVIVSSLLQCRSRPFHSGVKTK